MQVASGPSAAPHATQAAAAAAAAPQGFLKRVTTGTFGGALCPCRDRFELRVAGHGA